MPPEKLQWKHLYDEVVTTGLCTGCAGCVVVCPHDVLGYRDDAGIYQPFQTEDGFSPGDCSHGQKGCTTCTRACPRFRTWETEADEFLFGRVRAADEVSGVSKDIVLARATDPVLLEVGQDGGLVSALLLYALENDIIDAALVSYLEGDGSTWKAIPGVARTKEDIIASAGSRYTYSANPMAYAEAVEGGAERIALVGMSCQSSSPAIMKQRKVGKVARRISLNIGLLCSKTFDDAIFDELLDAKYGLKRADIKKMNIKGRLQIWMHDGDYHEVPLKECHQWTREGCKMCPDFAAEHADISTGGIGAFNDWTLTLVRTDIGRDLMDGMQRDGWIEVRPGDDDPGAIELLHKLSAKSRKRWPEFAVDAPRLLGASYGPGFGTPRLRERRRGLLGRGRLFGGGRLFAGGGRRRVGVGHVVLVDGAARDERELEHVLVGGVERREVERVELRTVDHQQDDLVLPGLREGASELELVVPRRVGTLDRLQQHQRVGARLIALLLGRERRVERPRHVEDLVAPHREHGDARRRVGLPVVERDIEAEC